MHIRDSRMLLDPKTEARRQMSCGSRKRARGAAGADDLAGRLYERRRENVFSPREAALKLKISTGTLQEWEQNRARRKGFALIAVNQALRS